MERIEGQEKPQADFAKQILQWITSAKRPLTAGELLHALAIEDNQAALDVSNLSELNDIIAVCAGLVVANRSDQTLNLVHYTALQFFEGRRARETWFPAREAAVASRCLTYLLFEAFGNGPCLNDASFEDRMRTHKLYGYAAKFWGFHAQGGNHETQKLALRFLQSERHMDASTQAMLANQNHSTHANYSQEVTKQITGAHLAAQFGLDDNLQSALIYPQNRNAQDSTGRTPLLYASLNGHQSTVQLLVSIPNIDLEVADFSGRTSLSLAAENGHKSIIAILLAAGKVDPDFPDFENGQTPLSWAAKNGHTSSVVALVETGTVDPNSQDFQLGQTPLSWAAEKGHLDVVNSLLQSSTADPFQADSHHRMPLDWAIDNGHTRVVEALLTVMANRRTLAALHLRPGAPELLNRTQPRARTIGSTNVPEVEVNRVGGLIRDLSVPSTLSRDVPRPTSLRRRMKCAYIWQCVSSLRCRRSLEQSLINWISVNVVMHQHLSDLTDVGIAVF